MIKPPFTAKRGLSGIWIEDGAGVTVADINPLLLDNPAAFIIAEFLANGANFLHERQEHARRVGALSQGRPKKKRKTTKAGK